MNTVRVPCPRCAHVEVAELRRLDVRTYTTKDYYGREQVVGLEGSVDFYVTHTCKEEKA